MGKTFETEVRVALHDLHWAAERLHKAVDIAERSLLLSPALTNGLKKPREELLIELTHVENLLLRLEEADAEAARERAEDEKAELGMARRWGSL